MNTGIIISTQSTVEQDAPVSAGSTAKALSRATGLPVIKMHRDAHARDEERSHLEQVGNGSIVYITGHSSEEADNLSGVYSNLDLLENPIIAVWQLEQYFKLILDNSSLKEGDRFTLVLWACEAGKGGTNSVTYKLGDFFRKEGIETRIICSNSNIQRFNSLYGQDEFDGALLRFRVYKINQLCIFDINSLGCTLSQNTGHLFFNREGIQGLALDNPQRMGYPLEIIRHKDFHPELKNASEAVAFFNKHPEIQRVFRPSSESTTTSVMFTASFRVGDDVTHVRFKLDENYRLHHMYPNSSKSKELAFTRIEELLPVLDSQINKTKENTLQTISKHTSYPS